MDFDAELDARHLSCPVPILCAKQAMSQLKDGDVLKVIADDERAPADFAAFSRQSGHELLLAENEGAAFVFYLRRKKTF
jgi:tRNA 2-thiouridine synthesizing protein A